MDEHYTIDEVCAVYACPLTNLRKHYFDEDALPTAYGLENARKWHEATEEAFVNKSKIVFSSIQD